MATSTIKAIRYRCINGLIIIVEKIVFKKKKGWKHTKEAYIKNSITKRKVCCVDE